MTRTLVVVVGLLVTLAFGCGNKDEIAGGAPAAIGATFDPVTDTVAVGMSEEQVIQAQRCFEKHDPLGSLGSCMGSVLKGSKKDCTYGQVCVQIAPSPSPKPGGDRKVRMIVLPVAAGLRFCDNHPIAMCDGVQLPIEAANVFSRELPAPPASDMPSPDSSAVSDGPEPEPELDPALESEPTAEATPEETDETEPEPEPEETDEGADVQQTLGLGHAR
jgi:hypothetical protein